MALRVPNRLSRAIQNDPATCILLVGAGLSAVGVRSGGGGLPDWDALIERMIDDLNDARCCTPEEIRALRQSLEEGKHLSVAEVYRGKTRPDQFAEFLRSQLDPPDISASPLHEQVLRIGFRGILCMNFDTVFEHSSDRVEPLIYPHCLEDIDAFRRQGFFAKIHGCIRASGDPARSLVLTDESYARLRANRRYQTILQSLLVMHPVMTVGFSLRDPDFLGWIEDLREVFRDSLPTTYSLMLDPGAGVRDEWRGRGVEIIPYSAHDELTGFFSEIEAMSVSRSQGQPPAIALRTGTDIGTLLQAWERAQKIEEMHRLIKEELDALPSDRQREDLLFRLAAMMRPSTVAGIVPHLLAVGTDPCIALVDRLLGGYPQRSSYSQSPWDTLKPHPLHVSTHRWVLTTWLESVQGHSSECYSWLLNRDWTICGVDLDTVFTELLNKTLVKDDVAGLTALYDACSDVEGLEGPRDRIEKIVLAPGFVRTGTSTGKKRPPDPRRGLLAKVLGERLAREFDWRRGDRERYSLDYRPLLREAIEIDGGIPEPGFAAPNLERVLQVMFDEYVQRVHMTLHSSSGLYDPARAKQIVEVLAEIRETGLQREVLWGIRRWWRAREGLGSRGEDYERLVQDLFVPLWWRYSPEVRLLLLESADHHRMMEGCEPTGHDLLLQMMGLDYDPDADFRHAFNASLEDHLTPDEDFKKFGYRYEPRALQDAWRRKRLTYVHAKGPSPELIRRWVTLRRDEGRFAEDNEDWWQSARAECESLQAEGKWRELMSRESRGYVVDELLGSYSSEESRVTLYVDVIQSASEDLDVDEQALSSVVDIHETVHAFSHLGRDLSGHMWDDFSLPTARRPDFRPVILHESIAQFYTFRLIEHLDDPRMLAAFHALEENAIPEYRVWRQTQDYSLEQMRRVLVACRNRPSEWPPLTS